jgi:hypothetical protein
LAKFHIMPGTNTYAMPRFSQEKGENELKALILELKNETGRLSAAMHPVTASAVASLVINMNSYYSNLIEGHFMHPMDIENRIYARVWLAFLCVLCFYVV